jgi:RNA polymerase sigma-70 factor, ECF subfamily
MVEVEPPAGLAGIAALTLSPSVPPPQLPIVSSPQASSRDGATFPEMPAERVAEHVDRLFRAAYALTGSRHDAEDLVQETFARVLARPRLVRRQDDPRYLMRALRNTWIDQQRARAARPVSIGGESLEWVVEGDGDPGGLALDMQVAYAAMRELSPKLREAIAAVDVLGLPYGEAARALGIRQGTLQSRLARARDHVSAALRADEQAA